MQARTMLLVVAAGMVGWVARGKAEAPPPPPLPAVVAAPPQVVYVTAPGPAEPVRAEEDDVDADPADGEDVAELLAKAKDRAAIELPRNGIHGKTTDERTGEPLAGVTVIATSPAMVGSQTAISDEHGDYAIATLPAGYYTVTFYYTDITLERDNVTVTSFDSTPVFQRMDLSPPQQQPIEVRTFDEQSDGLAVSFSGGTSLENTYYIDDVEAVRE